MDISEFKNKYIQDARELLNNFESDLLQLENNPIDKTRIDNIYRYLHTLKGSGGMYGFDKIVEVTHQLENIYKQIQDQKFELSKQIIILSFTVCDHLRNLLKDSDFIRECTIQNHCRILKQIESILQQLNIASTNFQTPCVQQKIENGDFYEIHFYPDESIINRNFNLINIFRDIYLLGECVVSIEANPEKGEYWRFKLLSKLTLDTIEEAIFFIADYCEIIIPDTNHDSIQKANHEVNTPIETIVDTTETVESTDIIDNIATQKSDRLQVDISRLNILSFLVSELVTSKSALFAGIQDNNNDIINQAAEKIDKISRLFHANVLTLRLVPIKDLTLQFKRLIHDLSMKLEKKIEFISQGEDIELDKNIIDEITVPIMHIIRNCIDHGIDTPDQRILRGKKEIGIIKLFAYKTGNFVFIQISDDGKGIDTQKVLSKAIEKGLISADSKLQEKEIFNLIFLPGLSTAETLSEISGRGIGMDIVMRKIQDLRGEIYIDSEKDLGSTFTIKLQQNISIIDTMLVECGTSKFAIPVEDIENFEIGQQIDFVNTFNATFIYKNEVIPVINLKLFLNLSYSSKNVSKLIIVNKYNKRFGIIVDKIIGEHQAVVKPLRKSFQHLSYYTGASALGDGTLAFLLDVNRIAQISELSKQN